MNLHIKRPRKPINQGQVLLKRPILYRTYVKLQIKRLHKTRSVCILISSDNQCNHFKKQNAVIASYNDECYNTDGKLLLNQQHEDVTETNNIFVLPFARISQDKQGFSTEKPVFLLTNNFVFCPYKVYQNMKLLEYVIDDNNR